MKERPILFSAPMACAILDGSKTQTRRAVKPQPKNGWQFETPPVLGKITSPHPKKDKFGAFIRRGIGTDFPEADIITCPYGQPVDRLWVRETWRVGAWNPDEGTIAVDYIADGSCRKEWLEVDKDFSDDTFERLWKQSTDDCIKSGLEMDDCDNYKWEPGQSPCRIRPSIHMPRWASRILLEITSVRVERLQDINEEDAIAEGIRKTCDGAFHVEDDLCRAPTAKECYARLWESINGPGSWDANPWVWVVEFKRVAG